MHREWGNRVNSPFGALFWKASFVPPWNTASVGTREVKSRSLNSLTGKVRTLTRSTLTFQQIQKTVPWFHYKRFLNSCECFFFILQNPLLLQVSVCLFVLFSSCFCFLNSWLAYFKCTQYLLVEKFIIFLCSHNHRMTPLKKSLREIRDSVHWTDLLVSWGTVWQNYFK